MSNKTAINTTVSESDIIGLQIVGWRYGAAPENGRSWNYRTNEFEPGVSMASVGYDKELFSFAILDAAGKRKKFYYFGTICGFGGDDEICLSDVTKVSYQDYLKLRKQTLSTSNLVVNQRINRSLNCIARGFNIYRSVESLEEERLKYLR